MRGRFHSRTTSDRINTRTFRMGPPSSLSLLFRLPTVLFSIHVSVWQASVSDPQKVIKPYNSRILHSEKGFETESLAMYMPEIAGVISQFRFQCVEPFLREFLGGSRIPTYGFPFHTIPSYVPSNLLNSHFPRLVRISNPGWSLSVLFLQTGKGLPLKLQFPHSQLLELFKLCSSLCLEAEQVFFTLGGGTGVLHYILDQPLESARGEKKGLASREEMTNRLVNCGSIFPHVAWMA